MNRFCLKVLSLCFLFCCQYSYGQYARKMDYEEVLNFKYSKTYFILEKKNDSDGVNDRIRSSFKECWTFNDVDFVYREEMNSVENKKEAYMIAISSGFFKMNEVPYYYGGLFVSSHFNKSTLHSAKKWGGGIFSENLPEVKCFMPLYVKMLNSMMYEIEENRTGKFTAKVAGEIYNKERSYLLNKPVYILIDQLVTSGIDYEGVEELLKKYSRLEIVNREEFNAILESEEEVFLIHFYTEYTFNVCSVISSKTGGIYAMGTERTKKPSKFFVSWIEDLFSSL